MGLIQAAILGFIQGVTEFLPISSDGHLSLANHFLGTSGSGSNNLLFTVLLHIGTLLAVFIVFWPLIAKLILEFFSMLRDLFTGRFKIRGMSVERRMILMLLVTLLPAFLIVPFKGFIEQISSDSDIVIEGFCFLFNGALILMASRFAQGKKTAENLTTIDSLKLGFFQAIAALPGVSRSGSTISVGLLSGYKPDFVVEFSFIMSIPAILAANILEVKDAVKLHETISPLPTLVGILVAAIVGFFAVKALQWLVKKHHFSVFGWYCLALGVLTVAAGCFEHISGHLLHI